MSNYPTVRPSLTLDFQKSKQLDPRISFSRASSATYVEGGVIKTADEHQARFEEEGLLIEEQRTNNLARSEELSNSYYLDQNVTVTLNQGTAPDGNTTANEILPTTGTNFHRIAKGGISVSAPCVLSIFVKANGYNYFQLRARGSSARATVFDLSNGTVTQEMEAVVGGTALGNGLTPVDHGNGWWRLSMVRTDTATITNIELSVLDTGTPGSQTYAFAGDGTSTVYVFGVQLEQGSFPTSYIPTSGSTVTRSADVAQITGDNFSSWYNDSEATIVSTQIDADSGTGFGVVWGFGTGGANRIELRQRSQEFRRGFYINGPSGGNISAVPLVYTKTSHAQQYTVGVAINASGADYAAEGVGVAGNTFTNATMPVIGTLYLSLGTQVDIASKTIARLSYYSRRLTDSELQTITL